LYHYVFYKSIMQLTQFFRKLQVKSDVTTDVCGIRTVIVFILCRTVLAWTGQARTAPLLKRALMGLCGVAAMMERHWRILACILLTVLASQLKVTVLSMVIEL